MYFDLGFMNSKPNTIIPWNWPSNYIVKQTPDQKTLLFKSDGNNVCIHKVFVITQINAGED